MESFYIANYLNGNIKIFRVISDEINKNQDYFFDNHKEIFEKYDRNIENIKQYLI